MASHSKTSRHGTPRPVGADGSFLPEHGWSRVPELVQWMVTLRCPLLCPHCLAAAVETAEMGLQEARRLVEEVAELGVGELLLTGGEPLARTDLPDIIAMLRVNGVRWSLNTAVAPDRRAQAAIEQWPPCFVAVSLDGPPEVHDAFRGRRGVFAQAVESIAYFRRFVPDVAAGTTVTAFNFPHLRRTFGAVLESGATCWGLHLLVPEGRAQRRPDLALSRRQLRELLRFAAQRRDCFPVTMADEIGYCGPWEPLVRDAPFFCGAGRVQCVVLPDGDVVPCTTLDRSTSAGNVTRTPLRDIWENGFAELRARRPEGRCARCRYAAACDGGCWLQRRHGKQCFRDAWRLPRLARTAAAVCLGIAATGALPEGDAAAPEPAREAVSEQDAEATRMEVLQRHIVQWYASYLGGPRAPTIESLRKSLQKELPDDPAADYLIAFMEGERPPELQERARQIEEALTTEQRSLCLIGLAWRDVTEWCLDGPHPSDRTAEQRAALRELIGSVARSARAWHEEILRDKLDVFLRQPVAYRGYLRTKSGRPIGVSPLVKLPHKRGYMIEPGGPGAMREARAYGEVMKLTYRAGEPAGFACLREGVELPPDGRLGVFDMLIVPAGDGRPAPVLTLTVAQTKRHGLAVALPPGTELTYGDVLRLAYEQNREVLDTATRDHDPRWQAPLHPAMLPALRAMEKQLQAAEATPEDLQTREAVRWCLVDLYLF